MPLLNPSNSFLTLTINDIPFKITKATIKESLQDLFSIECEGYYESLEQDLFSSSKDKDINFHPKALIDRFGTFSISNPYEDKVLDFNIRDKEYKGVITYINYHGINKESSSNIRDTSSTTKSLKHKHFFSFALQSCLIRLDFNKSNRIYTNTNVLNVIKETLGFYQGLLNKEIDFSNIYFEYEDKELISQYNESDLAFITRIAHNSGIFFYEDDEKIYFCDHCGKQNIKTIKYNPNANNILNEACINSFYKEESIRTNSYMHSSMDTSFPINLSNLESSRLESKSNPNNPAIYNAHSYEGGYSLTQGTDLKTPISLQEKRAIVLDESLKAKSNIYHLSIADVINISHINGSSYSINNTGNASNKESSSNPYSINNTKSNNPHNKSHQENSSNQQNYIIIANEQILIDDALLANAINTNDNANIKDLKLSKSYSNTITLLPNHIIFTPSYKPKPKAPSQTQGIVIGKGYDIQKEINTIYTDEYGRVKVRINLYANQENLDIQRNINTSDTNTNTANTTTKEHQDSQTRLYYHSPFLRVSTPIASINAGLYHTPRVGDEVIISFLDDDIDKPYISASLYNKLNTPLINLPLDDHKTSLSSKTIGVDEKGINEITLSNAKDKEQISIKAQKDYEEHINNNFTQTIDNNKESRVLGSFTESINKAHTQTITLAKNVNIGGEYLTNVALSKDTQVGLSNTLNIGASNKLRVAKDSSEYVGGDKEVEVGGDLNTSVQQDETREIRGNRREVVGGDKQEHIEGNLNITSQSQGNIYTQKGLYVESQTLSFQAKDVTNIESDSVGIDAQSDCAIQAGNQILHQVGDTQIIAKGDSVIIKAGGVEVVIDSNGLVVKGGEVKAE